MIEPNQSRLDDFDNFYKHREILNRGYLDAEKSKKAKNNGNECKWT